MTIVPLALAYVLFTFWRTERIRLRYVSYARDHPAELVETGANIGLPLTVRNYRSVYR